jgi:hypothetical protein
LRIPSGKKEKEAVCYKQVCCKRVCRISTIL